MAPPSALVGTADASSFLDAAPAVSKPVVLTPLVPSLPDNVLSGIGLIVLSTLFFSAGDVSAKLMTETMPALEVTWFRYLVFVMMALPFALATQGRRAFSTARPGLQFFRACGIAASSIFFIVGLGYLQPAEATAINFISPLFITALSIPLLGERVGKHRWAAAAVGFLGVMLIVRPGSDAFKIAALFPIGTAIAWAFAAIATRLMSSEKPEVTLAWTSLIGFIGLSIVAPFIWRTPGLREVCLGLTTGVLSTIGHWIVIKAYRMAPASVLAPFSYIQLVFACFLGFIVFGVIPGPWVLAGGVVIAASGLYTASRESSHKA